MIAPVLRTTVLAIARTLGVTLLVALTAWGGSPDSVSAQERDGACRVVGAVFDVDLGGPIAGASVWLEPLGGDGLYRGGTTSPTGSFSLETATCIRMQLRVQMLGYREVTESVDLSPRAPTHQIIVRLERAPSQVDELFVEVPRSPLLQDVGFYARKAWEESIDRDYGQFYDPKDVEGRAQAFYSVRQMVAASRIRFTYGGCRPSLYIDGELFERRHDFWGWVHAAVRPEDVEGIEIYRSTQSAIPEGFRDRNSSCGVVLVWTKGNEFPSREVHLCERTAGARVGIEGTVKDELTGVALPAAYVRILGTEETTAVEGSTALNPPEWTMADESGRYRYCDLEALPTSIQAKYGDVLGQPVSVGTRVRSWITHDLTLRVSQYGEIRGHLVQAKTEEKGSGIVVTLEGTDKDARVSEDGHFRILEIPPGDYTLLVTRRGDVIARREVSVTSGGTEEIEIEREPSGSSLRQN